MAFSKQCLLSTVANYFLFVTVFLGSGVLFLIGKPFERGFFCDDDSIKYPVKSPTISNVALYLVSFFGPLIVLGIGEIVHILHVIHQRQITVESKISKAKHIIKQISNTASVFLFGFAVTQFSFDILKYSIGRLRPHFLDVCRPGKFNCTGQYIEDFVCTAGTEDELKQARLSFPSGHAALSMYAMLYLILFIQERFYFRLVPLVKPFLQMLCFYITLYCSASRIFDYWHHPTDVIAGFILGTVMAIVMVKFVSHNFKSTEEIQEAELLLTSDKLI